MSAKHSLRHVEFPNPILPRAGEVQLKVWLEERGRERGISGQGYYMRLDRGLEPWPPLRRVNKRVVYVQTNGV